MLIIPNWFSAFWGESISKIKFPWLLMISKMCVFFCFFLDVHVRLCLLVLYWCPCTCAWLQCVLHTLVELRTFSEVSLEIYELAAQWTEGEGEGALRCAPKEMCSYTNEMTRTFRGGLQSPHCHWPPNHLSVKKKKKKLCVWICVCVSWLFFCDFPYLLYMS